MVLEIFDYKNAGHSKMTLRMLIRMKTGKWSWRPDINMYNMAINSMCKDGMVDAGLELFDYMFEKGIDHT